MLLKCLTKHKSGVTVLIPVALLAHIIILIIHILAIISHISLLYFIIELHGSKLGLIFDDFSAALGTWQYNI